MKKHLVILYVLVIAFGTNVQAQGLNRQVIDQASNLKINGTADVFLSVSNETSISTEEDDLDMISFENLNGTLSIETGGADAVYVSIPSLTSIHVQGSGNVSCADSLSGEEIKIITKGSGDLSLVVNYNTINAEVGGSTSLSLSGRANYLEAKVKGAGDLKAYRLPVNKAQIDLSGAGDAQVYVIDELKGNVEGAGTLYHRGNPDNIDVEVSGAGEVKRSNNLSAYDTTRIKFGNKKIIILDEDENVEVEIGDDIMVDGEIQSSKKPKKPKLPSIWSGFELGINGYMNADNTFNMDSLNSNWELNYGKSIVVNFNLWEKTYRLVKENITVTTGFGSEINNYRFDKKTRLLSDTVPVTAIVEADKEYEKTKLVTGFLNVPLYLTFATNELKNGKRIHFSPGATVGWRFTAYNKRVINENGDRNKSRNNDDFNLNPFRVNASLRVGYGSLVLFANYALTPMFKNNEGPDLMPFSAGIRIVGL